MTSPNSSSGDKTASTPSDKPDKYWASLPDDEFCRAYFGRVAVAVRGGGAYGYLGQLQLLAHRHYYGALPAGYVGDMPTSAEATRSGSQGENVAIRVNWFRSNVNAQHQVITAPELAWSCQATNTDSESLADASRGNSVIEYMWKQEGWAQQAKSAVLGASLYSEEFVFTYWNEAGGKPKAYLVDPENEANDQTAFEGCLEWRSVPAWDTLRDTSAKSYDASQWVSVRWPENRFDLVAAYPQFADEILAADSPPLNTQAGVAGVSLTPLVNVDKVLCHYFFHKKTPAMPRGRYAILISSDCILYSGDLPDEYSEPLPVHRMMMGELKGTPYGYTNTWEAMGIQDIVTDLQGAIATNTVAFSRQMISATKGTNLDLDKVGNGPWVMYKAPGADDPKPIQLTACSPDTFKHLDRLKVDQRTMFGLNDLNFGEAPTGAPNAQAWALLSSAAITSNSDPQSNYVKFVQSAMRSSLKIWQKKLTTPKKVALVGIYGAEVLEQDAVDQKDFEGINDVIVTVANPISQTAAGRVLLGEQFIQAGFVETPEQLQEVQETGNLTPLTQGLRDETIYIAAENEQMMGSSGKPPENPPVKITDSHELHIKAHRAVTWSVASRMNPAVNQAADQHIAQHVAFLSNPANLIALQAMGQAVPPAAMPMPAPPGPGTPQPPSNGPKPTSAQVQSTLATPGENQQQKTAQTPVPKPPVPNGAPKA